MVATVPPHHLLKSLELKSPRISLKLWRWIFFNTDSLILNLSQSPFISLLSLSKTLHTTFFNFLARSNRFHAFNQRKHQFLSADFQGLLHIPWDCAEVGVDQSNKGALTWLDLIWSDHRKVMFYGEMAWDPWLIIAQIACLQCLYYLTLGLVLALLLGTRVSQMSLFYIFDFAAISVSSVTGWCVIASFLLTSLAG